MANEDLKVLSKTRGRGQPAYKAAGFKSQQALDDWLKTHPENKKYFE